MHLCHCFGPRNAEGKQSDAAASRVCVDRTRSVDEKPRWYLSVRDRMLGDGESGRSIGRGVRLRTLGAVGRPTVTFKRLVHVVSTA
jgi:hypothetical protein